MYGRRAKDSRGLEECAVLAIKDELQDARDRDTDSGDAPSWHRRRLGRRPSRILFQMWRTPAHAVICTGGRR